MALDALQIRAAHLLASGETIDHVSRIVGRSPKWINNNKNDPEFREYLEAYTRELHQSIRHQGIEEYKAEIFRYRERTRRRVEAVDAISFKLLEAIEERLKDFDVAAIPARSLPTAIKQITEVVNLAQTWEEQMLGLDKLAQNMLKIEALGGFSDDPPKSPLEPSED